MDIAKQIAVAEKHRTAIERALERANFVLAAILGENATIMYQSGDGWVVVYEHPNDERCPENVPVGEIDFKALLKMSREEAFEYLKVRGI